MKTSKRTLENILEEFEVVFIRYESNDGYKSFFAGGLDHSGTWREFESGIGEECSLTDIARNLQILEWIFFSLG